jgi:ferric-dicitrate binding protein FerR (iron transport regulator)
MINNTKDRELEEKLRALPTAAPPAEWRAKILSKVQARRRQPFWRRPYAFALCIVLLLILDFGLERVQSAHIARLSGDGSQLLNISHKELLIAFAQHREMLELSLENGETP